MIRARIFGAKLASAAAVAQSVEHRIRKQLIARV